MFFSECWMCIFSLCENVVPKFVEILRWWTAGSVRVLGFVATSEWITSEVLENVIVRSCDGIEMWFRVVGVVAYHNVVGVVWYIELVTIFICFCHYRLPDINIECDVPVICFWFYKAYPNARPTHTPVYQVTVLCLFYRLWDIHYAWMAIF